MNKRNHTKGTFLHNLRFDFGGANAGTEYMVGHGVPFIDNKGRHSLGWHDVDQSSEGPCVHDALVAYFKDHDSMGGRIPQAEKDVMLAMPPEIIAAEGGGVTACIIHHRPYEDGDDHVLKAMTHAINGARSHIRIMNRFLDSRATRQRQFGASLLAKRPFGLI